MPQSLWRHATRALAATLTTLLITGLIVTGQPATSAAADPSPVISSTPGHEKFFVLESRAGWRLANGTSQSPGAYIREVVYETTTDTFPTPGNVVGDYIDLPLREEVTHNFRSNVNSLGVSPDGTFYFTTQLGSVAQQGTVDVWQYRPFDPAAGPATPVAEDFMLNSMGGVIVGGAVNPRDLAYYFLYFSRFESEAQATDAGTTNPQLWEETLRAHIYRYDTTRTPQAGEVSHLDFYINDEFSRTSSLNGDIAFDRQGNLHLVVSTPPADGNPGVASLATLSFAGFGTLPNTDPQIGSARVPTLAPTTMRGGSGQTPIYTVGTTGTYNGIAFAESGSLIVGQGSNQTLSDPFTFAATGSTQTLTPSTNFNFVDLASAATPPTITVEQVVLGERHDAADQFTLRASQTLPGTPARDFTPALTTGTASGTQIERIGPSPMLPQGVFAASSTATASDGYSTRYECSILDALDNPQHTFHTGTGNSLSFPYLDTVPGANLGSQAVKCVFISEPLLAELAASKSAVPASGTELSAGDTVQYALTFDNTGGTADALNIDYTEQLAGVLAHADFGADSVRYGDGTESEYPASASTPNGLSVGPLAAESLQITGTVPAGEIRTVWFAVTVTADTTGSSINNYLVRTGDDTPASCDTTTSLCTSHPVHASGNHPEQEAENDLMSGASDPSTNESPTLATTGGGSLVGILLIAALLVGFGLLFSIRKMNRA